MIVERLEDEEEEDLLEGLEEGLEEGLVVVLVEREGYLELEDVLKFHPVGNTPIILLYFVLFFNIFSNELKLIEPNGTTHKFVSLLFIVNKLFIIVLFQL